MRRNAASANTISTRLSAWKTLRPTSRPTTRVTSSALNLTQDSRNEMPAIVTTHHQPLHISTELYHLILTCTSCTEHQAQPHEAECGVQEMRGRQLASGHRLRLGGIVRVEDEAARCGSAHRTCTCVRQLQPLALRPISTEKLDQAKVSVPKKKEMLVLGSALIFFVVGCSPALCLLAPPFMILDLLFLN